MSRVVLLPFHVGKMIGSWYYVWRRSYLNSTHFSCPSLELIVLGSYLNKRGWPAARLDLSKEYFISFSFTGFCCVVVVVELIRGLVASG